MYLLKPSLNKSDLAIIERSDTAAHDIEAGQYVSWHGKLGRAKSAILQGATLDDNLFDYEEDGALNYMNNYIIAQSFVFRSLSGGGNKQTNVTIPEGYSLVSAHPLYTFPSGNESLRLTDTSVTQNGTTCTVTSYVVNPSGVSGYSIYGAFLLKRI